MLPSLLAVLLMLLSFSKGQAQYEVREAYPNLQFTNLVELVSVEDGRDGLYAVTQGGVIYWFSENPEDVSESTIFLDLSSRVVAGGEKGLLGLAFHPDFRENGFFYVNYTTGDPLETRISRFSLSSADAAQADLNSEQILLTYDQPYENHNGGKIAFGPDNFLYISSGDGGSAGDPHNNAQNREKLLGKILRIDVNAASGGRNYAIPADNPFANNTEGWREEIYAYGLRNTWKFSFDPVTGELWGADVGQNQREEINIIENGGNYGWRIMEGSICYNPPEDCSPTGLTLPVHEYSQSDAIGGRSITGGHVYRGSGLPSLQGFYIYGDFISGNIWALALNEDGTFASNTLLLNAGFNISSFAVDHTQELLVLQHGNSGKIWRLSDLVTGVTEDELAGVEVFPNPASAALVVRLKQIASNYPVSVRLYNSLGQSVMISRQIEAGREAQVMLDTSGLTKGLYTLEIAEGRRLTHRKVVVQ